MRSQGATSRRHPPLRTQAAALLDRACGTLERRPWLVPAILLTIYIPAVLAMSQAKGRWHDELFTFYIAQAPTLGTLWSDLKNLDLNPPLVYLLTRLSFRLFGINTLATRLPEMAFFLVTLLAIFRFVSKRIGPLFGGFAAALLMVGTTFDLALEARPYTLLVGFFALALVGWQEATGEGTRFRRVGVALLAFSAVAMLLSHIFAMPTLTVLGGAEAWRAWKNRQIDRPVLLALLLPFAVTSTYLPMLRAHARAIYPSAFQPSGQTIFDFYIGSIERELIVLLLTALVVLIALGPTHLRSGPPHEGARWSFHAHEWVMIVGLMVSPLLLQLYLMASHGAFFPRYGASAGLGVALLTTALLARWTTSEGRPDGRTAMLGTIIALLISGLPVTALGAVLTGRVFRSAAASEPHLPPCQACQRTAALSNDGQILPLVDASGLTFVEMNHHESPQTVARLFYLTDAVASTEYAHANIFERMAEVVDTFHLHGHVMNYSRFIVEHPHFYVFGRYDYPEDWLLRKLTADGVNIRVVGRTSDAYRDNELYEVTIHPGASR